MANCHIIPISASGVVSRRSDSVPCSESFRMRRVLSGWNMFNALGAAPAIRTRSVDVGFQETREAVEIGVGLDVADHGD